MNNRPAQIARFLLALLAVSLWFDAAPLPAETIARCGQGWLEEIDGYAVLHLKGSPYEMGYQHGALLRERAKSNLGNILAMDDGKKVQLGPIEVHPSDAIKTIVGIQKEFVPPQYFEEMRGLSEASGIALQDVQVANFIPELFHCSGFAIMNSATKDGTLYHGRVLDYAIDWGLQDHAVVIVYEPDGGIPFVNVSYAGFLGCVTGMNARGVSIGEMGGGGQGHWKGMPMALLVRDALVRSETLDQALEIFEKTPRTCQYFYVVADGKSNQAVGMEASWDVFSVVKPGEAHPLLPTPVKDCALLSAGERYNELVRRVKDGYGKFTAESALHLMDRGVAMKSNLHNVLFEPKSTRFWVANASHDKQPAADQKYSSFQLTELLARRPDMSSPEIPLVAQASGQ